MSIGFFGFLDSTSLSQKTIGFFLGQYNIFASFLAKLLYCPKTPCFGMFWEAWEPSIQDCQRLGFSCLRQYSTFAQKWFFGRFCEFSCQAVTRWGYP